MSTHRPFASRSARSFASAAALATLLGVTPGCGGGGGGDGGGDGGGGGNIDCGFENRYLPFQPGYHWTYRVTDLSTGIRTDKDQSVSADPVTDDPDFPDLTLLEQVTNKATGSTVSLLGLDGEALVRYKQTDLDGTGALERTTIYTPFKIRLDESADRTAGGATFEEMYSATVTDAAMVQTETQFTESWEVIGTDVPCSAPIGDTQCLQVRRIRTAGGTSTKDYFFARGVGKIREEGDSQLEELASCDVQ